MQATTSNVVLVCSALALWLAACILSLQQTLKGTGVTMFESSPFSAMGELVIRPPFLAALTVGLSSSFDRHFDGVDRQKYSQAEPVNKSDVLEFKTRLTGEESRSRN